MSSWESSASHCIGDRIASHRWLCQRASSRHANKFLAFCRKYSYFHFQLRQKKTDKKMKITASTIKWWRLRKQNTTKATKVAAPPRQKNILFDQKAKKPKPVRLALTFRPAKKNPLAFGPASDVTCICWPKTRFSQRTRHGAHVWHSICARCQVSSIAPAAVGCLVATAADRRKYSSYFHAATADAAFRFAG